MSGLKKSDHRELLKLANRHQKAGALAQAEACYLQIVERDPSCDSVWHALGLLAWQDAHSALAIQRIETAIAHNPLSALYHRNLCEMQRRHGNFRKAEAAGLQACRLAPADCDAHYNLGLVYADQGRTANAARLYQQALQCNAAHGLSWNNLGTALEALKDSAGAQSAYERAIALNPSHVEAQLNLGLLLSKKGAGGEARRCYEAALAVQPDCAEAHYRLSMLKSYTRDDAQIAMLEEMHAASGTSTLQSRVRICFALGNALCDIGAYDRAFAAYEQGNFLQQHVTPADEAKEEAELARMLTVFSKDLFTRLGALRECSDSERIPVFVVGMPGPAMTLLERCLAAHPSVSTAFQPNALRRAAAQLLQVGHPGLLADTIAQLSQEDLYGIGQAYMQQAWMHTPDSRRIIDGMEAGFFYVGLLRLAVPQAKILHLTQDPMQACVDSYTHLPQNASSVTKGQDVLGRHYIRYRKLMQHWHSILPPGTILEVPLDGLHDNAEDVIRAMLEFIDVPWDTGCLQAHVNGSGRTATNWKHFAPHLRPLYETVKDWLPVSLNVPQVLLHAPLPDRAAESIHDEGILCYKQNRLEEALALFERALALKPAFPEALNSKGYVLQDLGRLEEALSCFAESVALAPELSIPRLNLGMLQLKLGQWESGWENYEARWTGSAEASKGSLQRLHCPLPTWNGEADTHDKRILIVTEQGFGDAIQFARYLPLLSQRFAKVGFGCPTAIHRLMEWSFNDQVVLFTRMPVDMQQWDVHCSIMSLPRAFGTRPASIPSSVPYLKVPRPARQHWQDRITSCAPEKLRVGIAWAGRKTHHLDVRRSLEFEQVKALFKDARIAWFSLQKWAKDDTRPAIPAGLHWIDWTDELADFADTAAMISSLDLIISVDSAMVHLAGALGKPVWMMNRFDGEWRWFHQRTDSPWYPGIRIFNARQFGHWADVVNDVATALSERADLGMPPAPRRSHLAAVQSSENT